MKRLELLDYARLLAALSVVSFHYLFNGIHRGALRSLTLSPLADVAKYGYLGVDFFFLISGYVIAFTARGKSPGQFATSRAVRLYPAFWVSVLLTAGFCIALGGPPVDARQVLLNLTMLPHRFGVRPVDGVYWSLQVELQFYAMVLLLLLAGAGRHLDRCFLLWPLLMLVAFAAGQPELPMLGGSYPLFAAGALFAMMRERVTVPALAALGASLFLALINSTQAIQHVSAAKGVPYSSGVVAGALVCMFAFFFVLNTQTIQALRLPGSRQAGALTYPLYLLHATIGYLLLQRFATDATRWPAYAIVLAFVLALAWAVHVLVERRPAWQALFAGTLGRLFDTLDVRQLFRSRRVVESGREESI